MGMILWPKSLKKTSRSVAEGDPPPKEDNDNRVPLPTHIERELKKEARRQKMIPWITMKKPMYDNVFLTCPENRVLGTISEKKAAWYIQRQLADWADNELKDNTKTLRLNFTPAGRSTDHVYNISMKDNCCVACGSTDEGYSRHYIVPYVYRCLFPVRFKTHLPHDIVILCPSCHVVAEQQSHWRMQELETSLRPRTATHQQPYLVDSALRNVRTAANALLKYEKTLPPARILEFQERITAWARENDIPVDDPSLLQKASSIECRRPNARYMAGADVICQSLLSKGEFSVDLLTTFVREWRQHFLDVLQPQHLPTGWSVDSPVQSDVRKKSTRIRR